MNMNYGLRPGTTVGTTTRPILNLFLGIATGYTPLKTVSDKVNLTWSPGELSSVRRGLQQMLFCAPCHIPTVQFISV